MAKGETRNTKFSHFITYFARENCDCKTIKRSVCRKCFRKIALKIAAIVYVSFYDQCSQIRTLVPKPNFLIEAISWHFLFSSFSLSLSLFLRLVHDRGRARIRKEFGRTDTSRRGRRRWTNTSCRNIEEGRNGNGLLVGRFKDRRIRLNCSSNRRLGREASHGVTKRLEKLDVRPVKGIS